MDYDGLAQILARRYDPVVANARTFTTLDDATIAAARHFATGAAMATDAARQLGDNFAPLETQFNKALHPQYFEPAVRPGAGCFEGAHEMLTAEIEMLTAENAALRVENLGLKQRWLFRDLGDTYEHTEPDVPPEDSHN